MHKTPGPHNAVLPNTHLDAPAPVYQDARREPTRRLPTHPNTGVPVDFMADIAAFHEKYGIAYNGPPRRLPSDLGDFRGQFLREEADEYVAAFTDAEKLDAIVDLIYVAVGTAYLHGYDINEAWRRVHAANMRKVRAQADGSDSKRGSSHDVVKPAGWTPPDLNDLV